MGDEKGGRGGWWCGGLASLLSGGEGGGERGGGEGPAEKRGEDAAKWQVKWQHDITGKRG